MEIQKQPKLEFKGINIVRTSFNARKMYNFEENMNLNVDAKLVTPTLENSFQILMNVSLSVQNCFNLEVVGVGNFDLSNDLQGEERQSFININAPAIMFPYLRAFVATFSANCGETLPKLVIPTQFFKGDLDIIELNK